MAGERRGRILEHILYQSLQECVTDVFGGDCRILENPKNHGLAIRPDVLVVRDLPDGKWKPEVIFQVTWTPQQQDLRPVKFWRDFGEILDCKKTSDTKCFWFFGLLEDARCVKLATLGGLAWDYSLCLGEIPGCSSLLRLVGKIEAELAKDGKSATPENIQHAVQAELNKQPDTVKAFAELAKILRTHLAQPAGGAMNYWSGLRKWLKQKPPLNERTPDCRNTFLRWGVSELASFSPPDRKAIYAHHYKNKRISVAPLFSIHGEILSKTIGGYQVKSEALAWFLDFAGDEETAEQWLERDLSSRSEYLAALKDFDHIESQFDWIVAHWDEMGGSRNLREMLDSCYDGHLRWNENVAYSSLWLFSSIKAILKSLDGTQSFGWMASVVKETGTLRSVLTGQILPNYDKRIARPDGRYIKAIAKSLSAILKRLDLDKVIEAKDQSIQKSVRLLLRNKMLCHGVDPILYALCGQFPRAITKRVPSGLVEYGRKSGKQATLTLNDLSTQGLLIGRTFVKWQSAYGKENSKHKMSELRGRHAQFCFEFSPKGVFVPRRCYERALLIIDGTWTANEIELLGESGWDKIVYADDMQEVVKFIESR